jgi:FSR family fosmidomycin resistance protein-like MFS transporter
VATAAAREFGQEVRLIGLVGLAHGGSHFFQLVLPPLFPFLHAEFGASWTELGLVMTVFFATSGLAQTPAGVLVDRIGAARVLAAGVALLATGAAAAALAPSLVWLIPAAILLGLGNSVFHPADYAILGHHVAPARMARAFSVHTVGGTLGWALAPALMASLAALTSWRTALVVVACLGAALAVAIWREQPRLETPAGRGAPGTAGPSRTLAVFLAAPVLVCFAFFCLQASAFVGVQSFMPLALVQLHGLPIVIATSTVTAFMLGSAIGTIAGGVIADRSGRFQGLIAAGLGTSALLILMVGQLELAVPALLATVALAGSAMGFATPSRDMLVRAAAPPGSAGRVFGFVYSGLDLGATLTPVLLGLLLDAGQARGLFVFVAAAMAASVLTAGTLRPAATVRAR